MAGPLVCCDMNSKKAPLGVFFDFNYVVLLLSQCNEYLQTKDTDNPGRLIPENAVDQVCPACAG
jgi:hypothetical protein